MGPALPFTSVVGRPQPGSESENLCMQIVSPLSLEVFKESMPASGEEASGARWAESGGGISMGQSPGYTAVLHMSPTERPFLVSVNVLLRCPAAH